MASVSGFERAIADVDPRAGPSARRAADPVTTCFGRCAEGDQNRSLSRLIESEIIPRLMLAHPGHGKVRTDSTGTHGITPAEVAAFAPLSLQIEADSLLDHAETILARGVPIESLLVDLLAPAARLLGEYWEDDRCDFVDVTMGLWRLQEVVHELSARAPVERDSPGGGRRALFATMPGDQHSFGTVVVDELFAREGWLTDRLSEPTNPELLERVAAEWFDLLGLTISCDCHIAALPAMIVALRTVARNPRMRVMVGGRIFAGNAGLAAELGADGTAPDAKLAVEVAGELVAALQREALY